VGSDEVPSSPSDRCHLRWYLSVTNVPHLVDRRHRTAGAALTSPVCHIRSVENASVLADWLLQQLTAHGTPAFVGIDGRSGAGKSTLAAEVAERLMTAVGGPVEVTVIEGDDFYAGGSGETWDRRTADEKADGVIDWRRQRAALEQLRTQGEAEWQPFDWEAEEWDSDTVPLAEEPKLVRATPVVLLEGAYSCRPELHDLLDLRVLLEVAPEIRRAQLLQREGDAHRDEWEARWSPAEDHYFGSIMPPHRFDLVLGSSVWVTSSTIAARQT
jgi:uridine kinase